MIPLRIFGICLTFMVVLMVITGGSEANNTKTLETVFNFRNYNNTCNFSNHLIDAGQICGELVEFCKLYHYMLFQAMEFTCTLNNSAAYYLKTINIGLLYSKNYEQFNNKTEKLTNSVYDMFNVVQVVGTCNNLNKRFVLIANTVLSTKQQLEGLSGSPYKQIQEMSQINILLKNTTLECKEYYQSAQNLTYFIKEKGMSGIFLTPKFNVYLLRVDLMLKLIEDNAKALSVGEKFVTVLEKTIMSRMWVFSPIMYTELLIGFLGNVLLLVIFIRHVEMQTPNNVMLINLNIADLLILLYNSVWISLTEQIWDVSLAFCRTDMFLKRLSAYLSTYCLVLISYQRYRAVSQFKKKPQKFTEKQVAMLMTLALWIMGVLLALPEAFFAQITESSGSCLPCEEEMPYMWYIRVMIIYIFPLIFIPICSILASIHLKESADNFPGEKTRYIEKIRNRIIAARALLGMIVLLAVSYIPIFILEQVAKIYTLSPSNKSLGELTDIFKNIYIFTHIVRMLFILNSAINPFVLYFLSSKFKKYFNAYIYCRLHLLEKPNGMPGRN